MYIYVSCTISESRLSVCLLSRLKRCDVRRRNFACSCVPSMVRTWAGSCVDGGHRLGENELLKHCISKFAAISSNHSATQMLVGRSESLSPSTSSQPTGTDMTSCIIVYLWLLASHKCMHRVYFWVFVKAEIHVSCIFVSICPRRNLRIVYMRRYISR